MRHVAWPPSPVKRQCRAASSPPWLPLTIVRAPATESSALFRPLRRGSSTNRSRRNAFPSVLLPSHLIAFRPVELAGMPFSLHASRIAPPPSPLPPRRLSLQFPPPGAPPPCPKASPTVAKAPPSPQAADTGDLPAPPRARLGPPSAPPTTPSVRRINLSPAII